VEENLKVMNFGDFFLRKYFVEVAGTAFYFAVKWQSFAPKKKTPGRNNMF